MRAALRTPGPMDARVAENLSLMVEGGRRIQGDPRPFWQAAWRAGFELHGSKLNPFTYAKWAARLTSKHLMEHYVPQVKDGAYLELGRQRLEAAMKAAGPKGLTDMERAAVLQEAGKHVDNILGQMIADNLHYSRGLKNTLSAAIGYPGWTLGCSQGDGERRDWRGQTADCRGGRTGEAQRAGGNFAQVRAGDDSSGRHVWIATL